MADLPPKKRDPNVNFSFSKANDRGSQLFVHLILNFRVCENDIAMAIEAAKQYEDEVIRE